MFHAVAGEPLNMVVAKQPEVSSPRVRYRYSLICHLLDEPPVIFDSFALKAVVIKSVYRRL